MIKPEKIALRVLFTIIILVIIIIWFISPIAKYLIEKYDEKYTGRQITTDWVYVNPFTGYIHLSNVKIKELKSDSVFFSANGISINIGISKLFSKTYEASELTLDQPRGYIIQNKKYFNFNDVIEKFSSKDTLPSSQPPLHFNILNIKINEGEFYYKETTTPINYFIKNVNIQSNGVRWNVDTIPVKFAFLSGTGSGAIKGDFTINSKNKDYRLGIQVHKFDLNIIAQYLKELTNYGAFSAILDADLKSKGNLMDRENITTSGLLEISAFHFGKDPQEDYASFDKLALAIKEVSPENHKYFFDSIILSHPCLKYERYDYLDNVQTMFGKKGANIQSARAEENKFNLVIEIADYIKLLSKNFFQSDYKINRLAIYNGNLKFNDYSLSENFSAALNPLNITADSIDKNISWVNLSFQSGIEPYGHAVIEVRINPRDSSDFDLQYHFTKLPISLFNPYTISYTSFPLDRGTIELNGAWHVRNGIIQSDNHLLLIDPRSSKRIKNKDTKWIPIPLIMSFIRERGNVVDYQIPITGNLKNPKFHLCDVFMDLLKNIFIKPATTPYRIQVKNTETEIEKSLALKWRMRSSILTTQQEKFIKQMCDFLAKNPKAFIHVSQNQYTAKEKEYILFYEAKKKYFMKYNNKNNLSFTTEDSTKVDKMSIKDSLFVRYLNKQANDSLLFTIQEKCAKLISSDMVNEKFKQLNKERAFVFMSYFKDKGVENQIKISAAQNIVPYNGFSFYKIDYTGEFPESLLIAYRKMNELNNEAPRDKFKRERNKTKGLI